MHRIRFVLCYIGPLPRYFPTFLATCAENADVDFLVASDQPPPPGLAPNVRWQHATLADLRARLSEAVGFEVALDDGYKLCDYKPVLGQVFSEELEGYPFWGFCDPDLVWGHIRSFATEERLAAHDVLSFRGRDFISGPCTLFRNEPRLNHLYAESATFERVFRDPRVRSFTEKTGRDEVVSVEELVASGRLVSFTDVVRREVGNGTLRWLDTDEIVERDPANHRFLFEWRRGHLFQVSEDGHRLNGGLGREVLFYHYVRAKEDPWFYIPERSHLPDAFRITDRGAFVPRSSGWVARAEYEATRLSTGAPRFARQLRRRVRSRLARLAASPRPA